MADKTGKAIKLTRDDLRSIDVGKTKTFYLPDAKACDNGKALTYQFQNLMTRIQQASAKLRNVFVKALLWC